MRPLEGIRVLDLGHIYQGPYCGTILAMLGAEVVKVEPPGGENLRYRSESREPPEVQFLNPGKRGIVLNLKTDEGRRTLLELVEASDVLVENFGPETMESLGVGYERLTEVNPGLVYGYASGFGSSGPYRDYPAMDLTIQAISGVMETTGYPDAPPVKTGPAIADFLGGIHLATGVVSALYQREQTGEGQFVEVGMMDAIYPTLASPISAWVRESDAPSRTGNQHSGLAIVPYNAYEVEDGYVVIICMAEAQWERLLRVMGRTDLLDDERYNSKVKRAAHRDEIDTLIQEWLEGKEKDEVVEGLLAADVPAAPVQTIDEVVNDPQLDHREMINFRENRDGEGKDEIPLPGMPIKFSESDPGEIRQPPAVGEHTEEVLADVLGYSQEEISALADSDAFGDHDPDWSRPFGPQ